MANNGNKIWIEPNNAVRLLGDIKVVLGHSSNDLGTLCLSSKINKWAKNKPVNIGKKIALTAEDRYSVNYGLEINEIATHLENVALANAPTADWAYLRPSAPYYRMLDFNGYIHDAQLPYYVEIKAEQGLQNYFFPKIRAMAGINMEADIKLTELKAFADAERIGWGVVYKDASSNIVKYEGWSFDNLSIQHPISQPLDLVINSVPGAAEAAIVIFKPNLGIINLPNAYFSLNLKNLTTEQYIKLQILPDVSVVYGNKNIIKTSVVIYNNREEAIVVSYAYYIKVYANGVFKDTFPFTGTKSISASTLAQYIPIGEYISGNYGEWRDESGYDNVSYSYELKITTDKTGGIEINKQDNI